MNSDRVDQFIKVGRVGDLRQYAKITPEEYREYKIYLTLDRLKSQQFITQKIKEYLEESREHYQGIQQQLRGNSLDEDED